MLVLEIPLHAIHDWDHIQRERRLSPLVQVKLQMFNFSARTHAYGLALNSSDIDIGFHPDGHCRVSQRKNLENHFKAINRRGLLAKLAGSARNLIDNKAKVATVLEDNL